MDLQIKRRWRARAMVALSVLLYALGLFAYLVPPDARASWMPGYNPTSTAIDLPLALYSLILATYLLVAGAFMSPRRHDPVKLRQQELEREMRRLKDAGQL